jgi:hypothetical protein
MVVGGTVRIINQGGFRLQFTSQHVVKHWKNHPLSQSHVEETVVMQLASALNGASVGSQFHGLINIRPHWALMPEAGRDPLTPEDVYVQAQSVRLLA